MDHVATTRRIYDAINAGDLDTFGALLAGDFVDHEQAPGLEPTREGVIAFFGMFLAAFPDLRMEPLDVLPSGDRVVARLRVAGTHRAEFMGMPATGRSIDVNAIDIMRFDGDGLAHEHWGVLDQLMMLQQLGAVGEAPPG